MGDQIGFTTRKYPSPVIQVIIFLQQTESADDWLDYPE